MSNVLNVKLAGTKVVMPDSFGGIDVSNVLYTNDGKYPSLTSITVTGDGVACFLFKTGDGSATNLTLKVDDTSILGGVRSMRDLIIAFPVKKGQTVKVQYDGAHSYGRIFGVKY